MRQLKINECFDYTSKEIFPYLERAKKKYRYVLDESKLTKEELIENNLLFVISVAKQYVGQGVPFNDLIQYGNLGLCEAAERYDPTKGFRFISFAVNWIRKEILEAINTTKTVIKLPFNVRIKLVKINKLINDYVIEKGEFPTKQYIYKTLKIPFEYIDLYYFDKSFISTDSQIFDGEDGLYFYDVYQSENHDCDWIDSEYNLYIINKLLSKLTKRNSNIIKDIYLNKIPLELICNKYKLSNERIRQICQESFKIMKLYKCVS